MKKSTFFDFLNRHSGRDFDAFLEHAREDVDYIDWHGYCLPMAYGDASAEYKAVRNTCALFDASPVKKYRISGSDAGWFLDQVMVRRMSSKKNMRVSYAIFCNSDGMLRDDGLLYKFAEDDYLLMVSELDHDDYFSTVSGRFKDLKIDEVSTSLSGLAIQGPQSCKVLDCMGFTSIEVLKPFEIKEFVFKGGKVSVARVGFTADLGYELWFEPQLSQNIEQAIKAAEYKLGIRLNGYGLTALNVLRIEGGFIVPGWDTAQTFEDDAYERTPNELGLAWAVELNRAENFIGKSALLKEKDAGARFQIKGFTLNQDCKPEDWAALYAIVEGEARQVGTCPSVAWSDGLKRWLIMASVDVKLYHPELACHVLIGDQKISCRPAKLPFVKYDRYRRVPASVK